MKDKKVIKEKEIRIFKKKIKKLEKSEADRQWTDEETILLSNAVRMSRDSIVISDLEGKITYVNDATLKMYRIDDRETLIGRDSFELIIPDERDIAINGKKELLKTGNLEEREHHITTRSGDTISVEMGIAIVKNAKGEPIGFVAISRDITERKKAEKELWKAYKQWETTFDVIEDSIFMLDKDLKILKCNSSTARLFGKSYKEIIGKHCWQLAHGTSSPIEGCPLMRMKKTLKRESMQLPIGDKWFEVSVDPILDSTNKLFGAVHIMQDITDRKRTEAELKKHRLHLEELVKKRTLEHEKSQQALTFLLEDVNESSDELQDKTEKLNDSLKEVEKARDNIDAILKSIVDGLIVTDLENRIILMNLAAEALLKVNFIKVLNKPLDSVIKNKELAEKFKVTVFKAEKGYQFDFKLLIGNTKYPRTFNARTSTIKNKNGKTTGIISVFSDVTREREIDRMKTEFLSTTAHELRTPLTTIQGFSEVLLTRNDLKSEEREKFLNYINKQAVNLGNIISDLLDVSRIESGIGFTLKRKEISINHIISKLTESYQIANPKHKFINHLEKTNTSVFADSEKIEQVMQNLLSNAVHYSPGRGEIRITSEISDNQYRVMVVDDGLGMTTQQVSQIFEKFYRANSSDTAPPGTGLGMSIVKLIIDAHKGKIRVESEPKKGTRVIFSLPVGLKGADRGNGNDVKEINTKD